MPRSYKVGIKADRDVYWGYTAHRFATKGDAEAYGRDLASQRLDIVAWEAHPCDDEPTHVWDDGKAAAA